jgi:hypothetical protein
MAGIETRYSKTPKGIEVIEKRSDLLPRKLRSALLLVFASKTESELREQGAAIGAPPDFLEKLLQAGLIQALRGESGASPAAQHLPTTDTERFIAGARLMEQSVANEAGLKAFFFQLKLQKCGNTADLLELAPAYGEFMEKHAGSEAAALYVRELRRLLGAPG